MKQKLLSFGLMFALVATVAMAWTGVDDQWWQDNNYSEAEQLAGQTYDANRTWDGYASYVALDKSKFVADGFSLEWTSFEQGTTDIKNYLDTVQTITTTTKDWLQNVYNVAVDNRAKTEKLWYKAMYPDSEFNGGDDHVVVDPRLRIARYYANVQETWQKKIDNISVQLSDTLDATKVRAELESLIAEAKTMKDAMTDETAKADLNTAIETAEGLVPQWGLSADALNAGVEDLEAAMETASVKNDISRLTTAIQNTQTAADEMTGSVAKSIAAKQIKQAQEMLNTLNASGHATVSSKDVTDMITALNTALEDAESQNKSEILPDYIAAAAPYKTDIPTEYNNAIAANANYNAYTTLQLKLIAQELDDATFKADLYNTYKDSLSTYVAEAKLTENPSAELTNAITEAEEALEKGFTQEEPTLTDIVKDFKEAMRKLLNNMDVDRWSHKALYGDLEVKPWKPSNPDPAQTQYVKLTGKYMSVDANTANDAVDLFLKGIEGTAGSYDYDWTPFDATKDYKANAINLSSTGVSDLNNWNKYGWSYQEHYNNIVIKAGSIRSYGVGVGYGVVPLVSWNSNDIKITNKTNGQYNGRYYTFDWTQTYMGGVYRVPTQLSIYDETGDKFAFKNIRTYISNPAEDGTYFINSDINLTADGGVYDNQGTLFDYSEGTAVLKGRWHHIMFIDKNQFLFHQAAQKAADWYNNNPDLRQYDTAVLDELRTAVETDGNSWEPQTERIKEVMAKLESAYEKVNMLVGDSIYGVVAAADVDNVKSTYTQDVERIYTVTGAPGDAIDALIIDQESEWTSKDKGYWTITAADAEVGADSTATITVKFNPGTNYPADYREYRAVLDVKVGNLTYQNGGKDSLQQNLYGSNPKLSLKKAELLLDHSLNLHRKDSITFDLFGHGYAYNYDKAPLVANFFSSNGDLLSTSEVKTTLAKSAFKCYKADNDLDQTTFTVAYYPEDLGADVVKVVITDSLKTNIELTVNAAKSTITFDPAKAYALNAQGAEVPAVQGPKADDTKAYFYPADGETYYFPISFSDYDGVNANTEIKNEDGNISIITNKFAANGLVEEHTEHIIQITMDNRTYFDVSTELEKANGTSDNTFVIAVKTKDLDQDADKGQHDGLLRVIWQDQDTIYINMNQTQPYFSEIVDAVNGNDVWEFTEAGDNVFYVDVKDVDNYYNYAVNFGTSTNTDWFVVNPSVSYQTTQERGTRRYRLKIDFNPHEVNTVYEDVLTLKIFDTERGVLIATKTIRLTGAAASVKGGMTGVNSVTTGSMKKDGKFFKNGRIVIISGGQEYNASGAKE